LDFKTTLKKPFLLSAWLQKNGLEKLARNGYAPRRFNLLEKLTALLFRWMPTHLRKNYLVEIERHFWVSSGQPFFQHQTEGLGEKQLKEFYFMKNTCFIIKFLRLSVIRIRYLLLVRHLQLLPTAI
jgi:hypothetical protein